MRTLSKHGVDILYVLTGQRAPFQAPLSGHSELTHPGRDLTADELQLLAAYRSSSAEGRAIMQATAQAAAKAATL